MDGIVNHELTLQIANVVLEVVCAVMFGVAVFVAVRDAWKQRDNDDKLD